MKLLLIFAMMVTNLACNGGGNDGPEEPTVNTPEEKPVKDDRVLFIAENIDGDNVLRMKKKDYAAVTLVASSGNDVSNAIGLANTQYDYFEMPNASAVTDPHLYSHKNSEIINIKTDIMGLDESFNLGANLVAVTKFKNTDEPNYKTILTFLCNYSKTEGGITTTGNTCTVTIEKGKEVLFSVNANSPTPIKYLGYITSSSDINTQSPCLLLQNHSTSHNIKCSGLYLLPPNDTTWVNVASVHPTATPGEVIVVGETATEGWELFKYNGNTYVSTKELTPGSGGNIKAIYANGNTIVVSSQASGDTRNTIYKYNLSSNTFDRLAESAAAGAHTFIFLGHQNNLFYYTERNPSGYIELYTLNLSTGFKTKITDSGNTMSTLINSTLFVDGKLLAHITESGVRKLIKLDNGTKTEISISGDIDPSQNITLSATHEEMVYLVASDYSSSNYLFEYSLIDDSFYGYSTTGSSGADAKVQSVQYIKDFK